MINREQFLEYLFNIKLNAEETDIEKIYKFLDIIYQYNKHTNITGTKEKEQIFIRHIVDSILIFEYLNKKVSYKKELKNIIDIGTGGGFPGILLSIFLKEANISLLDSRQKAIKFLLFTVQELGLKNIDLIEGRGENLAHNAKYREKFDLVVSRSFGKLHILSEIGIPFCKVGGKAIFYKGKKIFEELENTREAINILGAKVEEITVLKLPFIYESRTFLILKKEQPTLYKYPRKYAKMIKNILI